jgi:hypothetical protein
VTASSTPSHAGDQSRVAVSHSWLCEFFDIRTGLSWGRCSCGWGGRGFQREKKQWRRHSEIHARRLRARS